MELPEAATMWLSGLRLQHSEGLGRGRAAGGDGFALCKPEDHDIAASGSSLCILAFPTPPYGRRGLITIIGLPGLRNSLADALAMLAPPLRNSLAAALAMRPRPSEIA